MNIIKGSVHIIPPLFSNTLKIILLHYGQLKKNYLRCNLNILDSFKKYLN